MLLQLIPPSSERVVFKHITHSWTTEDVRHKNSWPAGGHVRSTTRLRNHPLPPSSQPRALTRAFKAVRHNRCVTRSEQGTETRPGPPVGFLGLPPWSGGQQRSCNEQFSAAPATIEPSTTLLQQLWLNSSSHIRSFSSSRGDFCDKRHYHSRTTQSSPNQLSLCTAPCPRAGSS